MTELPALTKFYGLTPSDIDHMTTREVLEYLDQMHEAREAAAREREEEDAKWR